MEPTTVTMSSSEEEDATCPSIPKSTRYILFIIQGIIGIILTIPPLIPGISKTAIYGSIIVLTA